MFDVARQSVNGISCRFNYFKLLLVWVVVFIYLFFKLEAPKQCKNSRACVDKVEVTMLVQLGKRLLTVNHPVFTLSATVSQGDWMRYFFFFFFKYFFVSGSLHVSWFPPVFCDNINIRLLCTITAFCIRSFFPTLPLTKPCCCLLVLSINHSIFDSCKSRHRVGTGYCLQTLVGNLRTNITIRNTLSFE